jgi:hypothetical protein
MRLAAAEADGRGDGLTSEEENSGCKNPFTRHV